jgi:arylsulfatase A-like enzyme
MKETLAPSTRESAWEVFGFAFRWWLFIFLTVLLPLDFLYRIGNLSNALSTFQILKVVASTVVFFSIIAFSIALLSLLLMLLANKMGFHAVTLMNKVNAMFGLFILAVIFTDNFSKWIKHVLNLQFFMSSNRLRMFIYSLIIIIFVIVIIIAYKFSQKIYTEIKSITSLFYKLNASIGILCIIFSFVIISLFLYSNNIFAKTTYSLNDERQPDKNSNIIIVTFDALAAQYTSLHGNYHKTTPVLEKLGQESYVFDNMYSSCNWTLPSLASLMSGKLPSSHGVNTDTSYFEDNLRDKNLPFVLKGLGYETALVWSNYHACPYYNNLMGFDKIVPGSPQKVFYHLGMGPNTWIEVLIKESLFHKYYELICSRIGIPLKDDIIQKPEYIFAKAAEVLADRKNPFFLWVHIYPPHWPYWPGDGFLYSILKEKAFDNKEMYLGPLYADPYPPEYQSEIDKLALRYQEHICYADFEFGKFLSFLKEKGLFDNSILIVSADHGEMFERGYYGHGGPYLYQPLIHVPLIMHLPGQTQGQRIGANVSLVDIPPTLLDLVGVKPPDWIDGKSFKRNLSDNGADTGTKFSMNLGYTNCPASIKTNSIAAIKGDYKLIKYLQWNRYELYNLATDPREQENLIHSKPKIFPSLKAEIDRIHAN